MKFTEEDAIRTIDTPISELMKTYRVGSATICRARKRAGLSAKAGRPKEVFLEYKTCPNCGKSFKSHSKHCSIQCFHSANVRLVSSETRSKISNKAKQRWVSPTENMLNGIEKRKLSTEELLDFKKYRNRLKVLTEKTYLDNIDEINPNGYTRGVAGIDGAYHLDHIIPARFGFENNIPPEVLAEKENLQILPWRENIVKGRKHEN